MSRSAQSKPLLALAAMLALSPSSATAQGLLEALFGGAPRPVYQSAPPALSAPTWSDSLYTARPSLATPGPSRWQAYCVRLCDGRYFPVSQRTGISARDACNALCPAAETKVFSGGAIDHAVAADGTRYGSLPTAFAYRKYFVVDCTCNGTSPVGLAPVTAAEDPTLQAGDIVATEQGLMAYAGARRSESGVRENLFTPATDYRGLSASLRNRLSEIPVAPTPIPVVHTQPVDSAAVRVIGAPVRPAGFTPPPPSPSAPQMLPPPADRPLPYWSLNLRAQLER